MTFEDMPAVPLTSIIIPVFNDEAGLRACLEGIARQHYPRERIEVIAVDNGSAPPLDAHQPFPFPVRIVVCPTPGSYAARNAGARAAGGEILAFIDADCLPDADWLINGVRSLTSGRDGWLVGGEVLFHEPPTRSAVALYQYASGFGQEENIRDRGFSATANLMCTRAQFSRIGPFNERLLSGGDREWAWRASTMGIAMRFEPGAVVRTHTRTTMAGAIRQARRVAAGRATLRKLNLHHAGARGLARHRTARDAIRWILARPGLTRGERLRILGAAILIRAATTIERLRLAMGTRPERR